jgi:hypothetical protein
MRTELKTEVPPLMLPAALVRSVFACLTYEQLRPNKKCH